MGELAAGQEQLQPCRHRQAARRMAWGEMAECDIPQRAAGDAATA